ncbi:hypothetical protein CVT26_008227 [Gymnopilus dilepis]|uniref:F-box domain-containing protein n=1 Tax=Gymnopilus dilepis TaxID=231916 RepID=A0A409XX86_9AGAR|nr:hypothetical protein CVT26_008227 [Gymnopilus dilepis]
MHPQPDQLTELDHGSRLIDMTAPPTETRQICTPSPASSLLPEILAIIFEMTVACYNSRYEVTGNEARLNRFSSAGDREMYWKGRRQAAWNEQLESSQTFRSASQVDNFWRRSALDCKCIWGMILDIDFNSDEWVLELVRRSGTAPLVVRSIYCPGYSPARFQTSPKWAILFDQAHRLRVLQVAYNSDDYMSPLLEVLKKPMPLLEDLHLENNDHIRTEEQPYDALDGPLLGGIISSLKVMVLNRFFMIRHIDFSPFDLVRLEISIDEMLLSFSTANLLDILAEQPNLETLKFQRRLQEEIHTLPYVEFERSSCLACIPWKLILMSAKRKASGAA